MNLYEIDKAILDCIDTETGEIVDVEKLMALQMERDTKVENVALWIKDLAAEIKALDAEKKAFEERKKAAETKLDSLKAYLAQALAGEKFSTTRVAVSFRTSSAADILDESKIPAEYMRTKTETEPDKVKILAALKEGKSVAGAALKITKNPQIR